MMRFFPFVAGFLLLCLLSCSGEKSSGTAPQGPSELGGRGEAGKAAPNLPPLTAKKAVYSLELAPGDASRTSTLFLVPKGFLPSDAKVEWLVNGSPVTTQPLNQLKAAELKKGDKAQARGTLKSGETISSNIVQIKNSSPELRTAKIMPEVFKRGDTLSIDATATDIDGDVVTLSYEWSRNGEPAGNSSRMEGQIKRGDKIAVKITPFDGEAYGRPLILQRDVTNMPPMILEDKRFNFDGKVWTYQVKATDPDNDPLAYSLKSGPAGMTIDPSTGFIRWEVPPDFAGKAAASVSVSDGHGGEAIYNFNVTITSGKAQ
jgi:hypothetical protein